MSRFLSVVCVVLTILNAVAEDVPAERPEPADAPAAETSAAAVSGELPETTPHNALDLFLAGRFGELEAIAARLRTTKARDASGEWQLDSFYFDLSEPPADGKGFDKGRYRDLLAEWASAYPDSVTRRVAAAHVALPLVWEAIDPKRSDVPPAARSEAQQYLEEVYARLQEAELLDPSAPDVYQALIMVGTMARRPLDEIEAAFEKGSAVEPTYYRFYYLRAYALQTEWYGVPGDVAAFAEQAVELTRTTDGEGLYARIARWLLRRTDPFSFPYTYAFSWPRVKQGFEDIVRQYPDSAENLHAFCLMACLHQDQPTARALFDRIGESRNGSIWRGERWFDTWKAWAMGERTYPGMLPLHYAAENGDLDGVKKALEDGTSVNATDHDGRTAFRLAMKGGHLDIVEFLLGQGTDLYIYPNVCRLLQAERFDLLESIAMKLRDAEVRYPSGEWQLHFFYEYLAGGWADFSPKDRGRYLSVLEHWRTAYPQSITQRVVLVTVYVNYAWEARGGGWASEVNAEGWRGFKGDLNKAWDLLVESEQLEQKDPELYRVWIQTAMGLNKDDGASSGRAFLAKLGLAAKPKSELDRIMDRGVQLERLYYHLYYARCTSLLPRWGGSATELQQFADQAVERTRNQEGEGMYARVAVSALRYVGRDEFVYELHFLWPRLEQGFRDILERFPDSQYQRSNFCLMACYFHDKQAAAGLFEEIGKKWDADVWGSETVYQRWRRWACEEDPYPGHQPLHVAAEDGDRDTVSTLLAQGVDVNAPGDDGETALLLALDADALPVVKRLLEAGANPNLRADDGRSPLYAAVAENDEATVGLLLEHGADPNLPGREGWQPLHLAAYYNYAQVLALMLNADSCNVNATIRDGQRTALYIAADRGNEACVKLLLDKGADSNVRTREGATPLDVARYRNNTAIVRLLEQPAAEK